MNHIIKPESCRRPGVRSKEIVLADGLSWGFGLPSRRLAPKTTVRQDGIGAATPTIEVETRLGYSYLVEHCLTFLTDALESGSQLVLWGGFFTLATMLLQEANDLCLDDCTFLLSVKDDEIPRLVYEVLGLFPRVCT